MVDLLPQLYERPFVPPPPVYLDSLFLRVQCPTPPLLEGRLDFLKGPRSNPPLPEGGLDIRKSPRSNPP